MMKVSNTFRPGTRRTDDSHSPAEEADGHSSRSHDTQVDGGHGYFDLCPRNEDDFEQPPPPTEIL